MPDINSDRLSGLDFDIFSTTILKSYLTLILTFFRGSSLTFYLTYILTSYLALIPTFYLACIRTFYLTTLDILFDINFDVLSGIQSGLLSGCEVALGTLNESLLRFSIYAKKNLFHYGAGLALPRELSAARGALFKRQLAEEIP